jgi:hypothetical protein
VRPSRRSWRPRLAADGQPPWFAARSSTPRSWTGTVMSPSRCRRGGCLCRRRRPHHDPAGREGMNPALRDAAELAASLLAYDRGDSARLGTYSSARLPAIWQPLSSHAGCSSCCSPATPALPGPLSARACAGPTHPAHDRPGIYPRLGPGLRRHRPMRALALRPGGGECPRACRPRTPLGAPEPRLCPSGRAQRRELLPQMPWFRTAPGTLPRSPGLAAGVSVTSAVPASSYRPAGSRKLLLAGRIAWLHCGRRVNVTND